MIKVVLSSIIDIISGGTPQTSIEEYWNNGNIGWLSVTDFNNDLRFVYDSEKKITKKGLNESNTKLLEYGDIIISARGTVGALAQIGIPMCFNQSCFGIRGKKDKVDNDFLFYALRNYVQHIKKRSQGSVFDTINLKSFDLMEIEIPKTISTQQKIAKVLSDLDAKIEINNRINIELEAMAKTLYDYWFVQFDFPDTNGKPYKSTGGKMDWNAELKREIPEGWEVKMLLDIATFVNGLACQKFRPKENEDSYRVIKIREMGTGFTENSEFVSTNIPEKVVIHNGDILFSWSATLDVKIWTGGTGALNQHIFKITSNDFPKSYFYFELLNYLQHFKMQAELRKTTMGHITQDHLRQSRITIPTLELIEKLDEILKPILDKKVKLEEENQELASLRDWLLPMLMNGQVSAGDVEALRQPQDDMLGMVAEPREIYKN